MSFLAVKIKEKIKEHDLSVSALEKLAGLKPSAVQNIIHGRSKKPSIVLIQAIALALNCKIEDFIEKNAQTPFDSNLLKRVDPSRDDKKWNQTLYLKCFEMVHSILEQQKIIEEKDKILDFVDEIYFYSLGNNSLKPDLYFANWLIKNFRDHPSGL